MVNYFLHKTSEYKVLLFIQFSDLSFSCFNSHYPEPYAFDRLMDACPFHRIREYRELVRLPALRKLYLVNRESFIRACQ